MELKGNINDLKLKLTQLKLSFAVGSFSDILVASLNESVGLMKQRIFTFGLDSEKNKIGNYISIAYRKLRRKYGRSVEKKDLEMFGDLRRSISVVSINNTKAQIRFVDDHEADIGRWQEIQVGNIRSGGPVEIFSLSYDEKKAFNDAAKILITRKIKEIWSQKNK